MSLHPFISSLQSSEMNGNDIDPRLRRKFLQTPGRTGRLVGLMAGLMKIITRDRRSNNILRFGAMMLLMWNLQASASSITWVAGNSNDNWSTTNNWQCNGGSCAAPMSATLAGADLTFGAPTGGEKAPQDNIASISLDSLSITSSAYTAWSINAGESLTITNANQGSTFSGTPVTNNGTLTINGTTNGFTNSSGITNTSTGTLALNAATVTNTGGTMTNIAGGTLTISSATTLNNGTLVGKLTNNGTLSGVTFGSGSNGDTVTNSGTITGGTIGVSGGASTINGGTISGATTGTFGTFNNVLFTGATLTNGSISGTNTATGTNTFAGSISNSGALTISSGTTTVSGTINSTGTTAITVNGTLNVASTGAMEFDTFTENSGGLVTLSGFLEVSTANLLGGTFDGTGAFEATTVDNGDGTNDNGGSGVLLYVGGSFAAGNTTQTEDYDFASYNQDAGGALGIAFNSSYSGLDQLDVTSEASINGSLDLYASNGAELNLNNLNTADSYVLIDGLVNGAFSTVNVTGALAGTASGGPGTAAGWWLIYNGSDAGGNGDVELDYVAPTTSGTPEPGTDILLGGALVGFALLRRKLVKR
jgi:hypothetical protein